MVLKGVKGHINAFTYFEMSKIARCRKLNNKNFAMRYNLHCLYLQPLDDLFEILRVVTDTPQGQVLSPLVKNLHGGWAAHRPSDHILGGAVEHYFLSLLVQHDDKVIGHGQQSLQLPSRAVIFHVNLPSHRPQAAQFGPLVRSGLLLLLVSQGDEGELARRVNGCAGCVALGEVAEVLLSGAGGHGAEFVGFVGSVLSVYELSQQEVPEDGGLGEGDVLGDERAEGGHIFGAGHGHTGEEGRQCQ